MREESAIPPVKGIQVTSGKVLLETDRSTAGKIKAVALSNC